MQADLCCRDVSGEKRWLWEARSKIAIRNLEKGGIGAQYVPDRKEALAVVLEMIPAGASVSRGDSVTLEQVGVFEALEQRGANQLINPFARNDEGELLLTRGSTMEESTAVVRDKMRMQALVSDVFVTSTNAVTLDGKLVSTDAIGNRVGPMLFGPKKVIFIASAAKIVANVDEAINRIHNYAAPMNAHRHLTKHHSTSLEALPCVTTGKCADCRGEMRICLYTVIIEGSWITERGRLNVVLVGEDLGI